MQLLRKWINQPSTLQPLHELHGTNVLYDASEEVIYFLSGPVISQQIIPIVLSDGWVTAPEKQSKHCYRQNPQNPHDETCLECGKNLRVEAHMPETKKR